MRIENDLFYDVHRAVPLMEALKRKMKGQTTYVHPPNYYKSRWDEDYARVVKDKKSREKGKNTTKPDSLFPNVFNSQEVSRRLIK